jgi:ubiquinone/menaquinone biosynthesis C-methylase UbiE
MPSIEHDVAEMFRILERGDTGRTVAQFRSLPQASQYRRLYSLVGKYMPAGARVLDWGCGNGHFSFFLATQGAQVTSYAFEPEPAIFSLLTPAQRERITFVRGSAEDPQSLHFPDASFDCVFSIGVLEHVRETGGMEAASLREIHRVLKPDGRFICYHLPNRYSYIEALNRLVHGPLDPTMRIPWKYHKYRFTRRDIQSLCEEAGFSMLELQRYGAIPRNMLSRLPGALGRSRALTRAVDLTDAVLERAPMPITQNYAFVASRA